MSNINIFDLPTLSVDNFYPDSDFVIVQRPGGGTYRILASEALSVSRNIKDRKSGAHDIILEESIQQTGENSETIIFENENLLEKDASWNINIALKILGEPGFDRNAKHGGAKLYIDLPSIGDQRFIDISKPRNSNLINSRYLVGKTSTLFEKFEFSYRAYRVYPSTAKNKRNQYEDKSIIYSVMLDTGEQNKIKLSFERSDPYVSGYSGPISHIEYIITLTAQI